MRPAYLAKIELPQQKESHNKIHQQGSIAALFLRVDKKDYSNSSPSSSASVFRYLNTISNESGEWSYSVIWLSAK